MKATKSDAMNKISGHAGGNTCYQQFNIRQCHCHAGGNAFNLTEELNRLVLAELEPEFDLPILLSYDTTCRLGDIYVASLLFTFTDFQLSLEHFYCMKGH